MFIGRKEEIRILTEYLENNKQENIVIYGRRRIGKSELIKETLRKINVPFIFYQAKETTIQDNIESLSKIIATHFDLGPIIFKSVEDIYEYLFKKSTEPFVFVVDEYPYLRNLDKGLDSILQLKIDQYKNDSKLKIVLLGSYIDIMERLNHSDNPLYGRISKMLFVSQMNYQDSSYFYEKCDLETKVKYYSVFGGMPYYNEMINTEKSFEQNIIDLVISKNSVLSDFIELTLSRELRKINHAHSVFTAIALGYKKYGDIFGQLSGSINSSQLAPILDSLIAMDLIYKTVPINELDTSKKTYYEINDHFISFFYKYIFKNISEKNIMDSKIFYQEIIEKDFNEQFVPKMFERIAKEYLIIENKKGYLNPPLLKIGKYWYDNPKEKVNGEFDLVSKDKNGFIIYEVKYRKSKITDKTIREEIEQLNKCKVSYYKLGFFSKSGFDVKEKNDDHYLKSLENIYKFE